jgi:hypothetical protein
MKTARIRIIKHEAVPGCGSLRGDYADDRLSQYFYWDDIPARRMRPETLDRENALKKAKAVASEGSAGALRNGRQLNPLNVSDRK